MPAPAIYQRLDFTNSLLLRLAAESDAVHAYLPTDTLCGEQLCSLFLNGVFLYHDDDHLNPTGSKQFAKPFAQIPVFCSCGADEIGTDRVPSQFRNGIAYPAGLRRGADRSPASLSHCRCGWNCYGACMTIDASSSRSVSGRPLSRRPRTSARTRLSAGRFRPPSSITAISKTHWPFKSANGSARAMTAKDTLMRRGKPCDGRLRSRMPRVPISMGFAPATRRSAASCRFS